MFAVVAVAALALGIGANTAIFSVVNSVLLRPLPLKDADRLVVINETYTEGFGSVSAPNYADWRDRNKVFESIAALSSIGMNLTGHGDPVFLQGQAVSPGFFETMKVSTARGRLFTADEYKPGGPFAVVLSQGLFQRSFGGDIGIIGKPIALSGWLYEVVGVLPAGFAYPRGTDLFIANRFDNALANNRGNHYMECIARLKPGITLEQARTDMNGVAAQLANAYPDQNAGRGVRLDLLAERMTRRSRPALLVLLGAVGFVLLIACANVANLLLARAATRQREIAVRTALGAGGWRIIRQLLTESVVLSLLGAVLGLVLANWGLDALIALVPAGTLPRMQEISIDWNVLWFTLALSLVTGVLFGLAPAVQALRLDVNEGLKQSAGRSGSGRRSSYLRNGLAVAEIAVAVLLLIGGGLTIKAFVELQRIDLGFNSSHLLTMELNLPETTPEQMPVRLSSLLRMLAGVRGLAGVTAGGAVVYLPLSDSNSNGSFQVEGAPTPPKGHEPVAEYRMVSAGYLEAMRIPLLQGRDLSERDDRHSPAVVLVNQAMAKRFWPGQDPMGKRVAFDDDKGRPIWLSIVGIAGNVRHFGFEQEAAPEVYFPIAQLDPQAFAITASRTPFSFAIRTSGNPAAMTAAVSSAIHSVEPNQSLTAIRTMDEMVSDSVARPRFESLLLGIFAALALLLAAAGVYSVMAYAVTQRTREIGLRMALGAHPGDVLRQVLLDGLTLAGLGVAIGLAAAFAITPVMANLLYGVSPRDPLVFALVPAILGTVAVIACWIPARRAAQVDPMIALRYE